MNEKLRQHFDARVEQVLDELPVQARELLEEIPLIVEDYPSSKLIQDLGLSARDELCGLYTGIPLIERSIGDSGLLPDCVTIFREGILRMATDRRGRLSDEELRRQIRITILHELGHHHGLDEDDLEELGYQ